MWEEKYYEKGNGRRIEKKSREIWGQKKMDKGCNGVGNVENNKKK